MKNQLEKRTKILRSNRWKNILQMYWMDQINEVNEIIYKVIVLYSPQSNGVAERKNKTLLDRLM